MKAVANRFSPRAAIIGLGSVLTAVVVPSCPLLMDSGLLKRVKDVTGPSIVIHSPSDGDVCANIVQVDGTVSDSATAAGNDGGATSLTYQVLGTTVSGEIAVAADGSSSFQLATITFGNTFTLSISATVGTELVDARSPLELTGMRNGYIHVFQLFAVPEDSWPRSVSGLVRTVPLSEQSLSPQGEGEVSGIRVSWGRYRRTTSTKSRAPLTYMATTWTSPFPSARLSSSTPTEATDCAYLRCQIHRK